MSLYHEGLSAIAWRAAVLNVRYVLKSFQEVLRVIRKLVRVHMNIWNEISLIESPSHTITEPRPKVGVGFWQVKDPEIVSKAFDIVSLHLDTSIS